MSEIKTVVYGLYCVCETCRVTKPEQIRYVGITAEGANRRLKMHLNESHTKSEKAKDRWIRKHGEEYIKFKILEEVLTGLEDLKVAEISWIAKLDTYKTSHGLNMTRGGDGVWGYKFSNETRIRFRERTAEQFAREHPRAILSEGDVEEIIQRIWAGEGPNEISKDFEVSQATVQKIRDGKNWSHIQRPPGKPPKVKTKPGNQVITDDVVRAIRQEPHEGYGRTKRIADKYNVSAQTVRDILNNRGRFKVVE